MQGAVPPGHEAHGRAISHGGVPRRARWQFASGRGHMADIHLDTTGLTCPLPILKAKKAIRRVPAGGTLEVIATDPGAVEDFETFCRVSGHILVESGETDGVFRFLIRQSE